MENDKQKTKRSKRSILFLLITLCIAFGVIVVFYINGKDNLSTVEKSVFTVYCYDKDNELYSTGSGFLYFSNEYIVTNFHVINGSYRVHVASDMEEINVDSVYSMSAKKDIAILHLSSPSKATPLISEEKDSVKKGARIITIGSPLGVTNTVSDGLISSFVYDDEMEMEVYQISAPISEGSGGGALFNEDYKLIGMTYAGFVDAQNMNLAIPVSEIYTIYNKHVTEHEINGKEQIGSINYEYESNKIVEQIHEKYSHADLYNIPTLFYNDISFRDPTKCIVECVYISFYTYAESYMDKIPRDSSLEDGVLYVHNLSDDRTVNTCWKGQHITVGDKVYLYGTMQNDGEYYTFTLEAMQKIQE